MKKNIIHSFGNILCASAILITLLVISISFSGCKAAAKEGGIFRSYIEEPSSLDPAYFDRKALNILKQLWDGLISYDKKNLRPIPSIAKSWEINEDRLIYTFHLQEGVKFHSGRELIAEDFVYSWSRLAQKDTGSIYSVFLEPIDGYEECQEGKASTLRGVRALDDYTLEVTLKYRFSDFLSLLGNPCFYPVAKEDIAKWGENYTEHINGTGPFQFASWVHNQYIEIRKNEDYWGKKAYIDGARFIVLPDKFSAFLEFKAGNLEETPIPPGYLKIIQNDSEFKNLVKIEPILGTYFIYMNTNLEPFKENLALRETVNYIIDRKFICNIVTEGTQTPAAGITPPAIEGFQKNIAEFTYDIEKAKQKLKDAGYSEGEGLPIIKLVYNTEDSYSEKIARSIMVNAKQIGINIELDGYAGDEFIQKILGGDVSFFLFAWPVHYPAMDYLLYYNFYSKSLFNLTKYNSLAVDEMLIDARKTENLKNRLSAYKEIEKKILTDLNVIPIYFDEYAHIIKPYVEGLYISPLGYYDLREVSLDKKYREEYAEAELQVKILEVVMANQVDENMEPLNPTNQFIPEDTIYACIKLDTKEQGNSINVKWYDSQDKLIQEEKYDITENYYQPSFITFELKSEGPWQTGKYKVEVYLNKYLYNTFEFEVTEKVTKAEISVEEATQPGNLYENKNYGFSLNYPADWQQSEEEVEGVVTVLFKPTQDTIDLGLGGIGTTIYKENSFDPNNLSKFADEFAASATAGQNFSLKDKQTQTGQISTIPYNAYIYNYTLNDKKFGFVEVVFIEDNNLYIIWAFTAEATMELADQTLDSMLNSLKFK